jgi:hypothetical protein
MKHRDPMAQAGLEYQEFLFAPLGDDRNGTPLAVASIMGRMSLDPWNEAASLAALPADAAVRRLALLIEAMPNRPLQHQESATLAAGLIKLLPARPTPAARGRAPLAGAGATKSRRPLTYLIWFALFCIFLLGATFA